MVTSTVQEERFAGSKSDFTVLLVSDCLRKFCLCCFSKWNLEAWLKLGGRELNSSALNLNSWLNYLCKVRLKDLPMYVS